MKSTAIFVLFCLAVSFASEVQTSVEASSESSIQTSIQDLEKSPVGAMIVALAEVHMELGGPVDELTNAIRHLIGDLKTKAQKENTAYLSARAQHHSRAVSLKALINSAIGNIGSATQKLNSVLYPRRHNLQKDIALLRTNLRNNKNTQISEASSRSKENKDFLIKQKEHRAAQAAVDVALKIVNRLKNPRHSLIQVRSAKVALKKLESTLVGDHATYAPLVQALISLSQNFADQKGVQKIIDLLQKIRANIVGSLQRFQGQEIKSTKTYRARVVQLQGERKNFKKSLVTKAASLAKTNLKIKKEELFKARRTIDLAAVRKGLAAEKAMWAKLKSAHAKLVQIFTQERATIRAAVRLLKGLAAQAYIKGRH